MGWHLVCYQPFWLSLKSPNKKDVAIGKSTHFLRPIYGQLIKSLERDKIVGISRGNGSEKYIKSLDGYSHLLTMLFAIISNDIFKVSEGTLRRAGRKAALRSAQSYTPMRECCTMYGSPLPQPMDSFMSELYPGLSVLELLYC